MLKTIRVILAISTIFIIADIARASVPHQISLQGRLLNASGMIVNDTTHEVTFRIYSDSITGFILWQELDSITTKNGLFQTQLGSQVPIPDSIFNGNSRYLSIQLGSNPEMPGRLPIKSEAYSYRATFADSVIGTGDSDWAFSDSNIYRLNGNVGIGTANPNQKLGLSGTLGIYPSTWVMPNRRGLFFIHDGSAALISAYNYPNPEADDLELAAKNIALTRYISGTPYPGLYLRNDGNVGIGTTSPIRNLDVNGAIRTSNGGLFSPTFFGFFTDGAAAQTIKAGALSIASSYSSNPPTNGLYVQGNVGIGTTTPAVKLHVNGDIRGNIADGALRVSTGDGYLEIGPQNTSFCHFVTDLPEFYFNKGLRINGGTIESYQTADLSFRTASVTRVTIENSTGNVGIGTASPANKLDVDGDIRTSTGHIHSPSEIGFRTDASAAQTIKAGALAITSSYSNDPPTNGLYVQGNVGIGTTTPDAKLAVSIGDAAAASFRNNSSGSVAVWVSNNSGVALAAGSQTASSYGIEAFSAGNLEDNPALRSYGRITSSGRIFATTSTTGINSIEGRTNSNYAGVAGMNFGSSGGSGVYGSAPSPGYAGYFSGNVNVTGAIYAAAKPFRIDHPIDPENKYLQHCAVESPDMMDLYNGNVILDASGEATVEMPSYFDSLNKDYRYQLTCIGGYANIYIAEKIQGNHFKISGGKPGLEVSWQITGIRKDAWAEAHRIIPEVDKSPSDRGKYLHPKELGKSESLQIGAIVPANEGVSR